MVRLNTLYLQRLSEGTHPNTPGASMVTSFAQSWAQPIRALKLGAQRAFTRTILCPCLSSWYPRGMILWLALVAGAASGCLLR